MRTRMSCPVEGGVPAALMVLVPVALVWALGTGPLWSDTISLGDADVTVEGVLDRDAGFAVAIAGDVNDDGLRDFLISSLELGRVWLIYGAEDLPAVIDLSDPPDGVVEINSDAEELGLSLGGVGDINDDGIDDFALGQSDNDDDSDAGSVRESGRVWVIFGTKGNLADEIVVEDLDEDSRLLVLAPDGNKFTGHSVSGAGDFNDDGIQDFICGSPTSEESGSKGGAAYLIFGSDDLPAEIDVTDLEGLGITFEAGSARDLAGTSVACLGDFNDDGDDEIAIGAAEANPDLSKQGVVYIISPSPGFPDRVELKELADTALDYHTVKGAMEDDRLGSSVARVGDVNDDGIPDALFGAPTADRDGLVRVGEAYILYGGADVPTEFHTDEISDPDDPLGVTLRGIAAFDGFGGAVTGVGDANADTINDVLIGAVGVDRDGDFDFGAAYLIFGADDLASVIAGNDLLGAGSVYEGVADNDEAGNAVAGGGDINGDGGDDFIVAASDGGISSRGDTYLFFGAGLLAPQELSCVATGTEIAISWTNPVKYDGIEVIEDGEVLAELDGDATSFEIERVTAGNHTYTVQGFVDDLRSLPAECTVSVMVLPPADLVCMSDGTEVLLSWTSGQTYSTGIEVLRDGEVIADLDSDATRFSEELLKPATYTYCVRGLNGKDTSTDTCCEVVIPLEPFGLECETDGTTVSLTWRNGDTYDTVKVFRDGELIATRPGPSTTFTDLGVESGLHTYSVQGEVGDDLSAAVECDVEVVAQVTDVACTAEDDAVLVTWTNGEEYAAVCIVRNGEEIAELDGDATEFLDEELDPGDYTYEVIGKLDDASAEGVACEITVLIPIADFTCVSDDDDVFLSWTNGQVYSSIEVRRDGDLIATLGGTATSFLDEGVAPGAHDYELTAYCCDSDDEARSTTVALCEANVLEPIFDVECSASEGEVTLTWENGSVYSDIEIRRNGGFVATIDGAETSFVDEVPLGSYVYELIGLDGDSKSAVAECEIVEPGAPSGLECTALDGDVTVSWTNGDDYDGIKILLDDKRFETIAGDATETSLDGLDPGTYMVCVIGVTDDTDSAPGCCEVTAPLELDGLTCEAVGDAVTLSWSNGQPYDTITIQRDDEDIATIPGGLETFTDTEVPEGDHTYGVVPSLGGGTTSPVTCEVRVLAPILDLSCRAVAGLVTIEFNGGETYDFVRLTRNGVFLEDLEPGATTEYFYEDFGLSAGLYVYELVGFVGDNRTATEICEVPVPLQPFDLFCTVDDGEDVELSWFNADLGDSITILRNDVVIADDLDGSDSSYTDEDVAPGEYEYCVVTVIDGNESVPSCCDVVVPDPLESLFCTSRGGGVELSWSATTEPDSIVITRNGTFVAAVPGDVGEFFDPELAPGIYTYGAATFQEGFESQEVECEVTLPAPVIGLVCERNGSAVELSWELTIIYDSIQVIRNGAIIGVLDGDADFFVDTVVPAGFYTYEVVGIVDGNESVGAVCTFEVLEPPVDIECCVDNGIVNVCVGSLNGFDRVDVFRDGKLLGALDGDDTCLEDAISTAEGDVEYTLIGVAGDASSVPGFCVARRPAGITRLECEFVGLDCDGTREILLSWNNRDDYDSIEILRDGNLVATVAGTTRSFTDTGVSGEVVYEVQALLIGEPCAVATSDDVCEIDASPPEFIRGNANNDDRINIADPVYILNYLFVKGPALDCEDAGDINDDGGLDIADPIKLVDYLFLEGEDPPAPFPDAGQDPTCDDLECNI